MNERTCKLVIEYDGTKFSGWQIQPDRRTVQQEVEAALCKLLGHPVRVIAAGRTDAGVHATGQVVNFKTSSNIKNFRLKKALNGILPRDVTILDAVDANPEFNARYSALSRTYRYTISTRKLSVGRAYAWHVKYPISRELLLTATEPLESVCNLEGFSKKNENGDYSTIIFKNKWTFDENLLIFEICAIRFFQHSVRSIVGSAIEVARGRETPDLLNRILETHDRSLSGPTAPAMGLCLVYVDYGEGEP